MSVFQYRLPGLSSDMKRDSIKEFLLSNKLPELFKLQNIYKIYGKKNTALEDSKDLSLSKKLMHAVEEKLLSLRDDKLKTAEDLRRLIGQVAESEEISNANIGRYVFRSILDIPQQIKEFRNQLNLIVPKLALAKKLIPFFGNNLKNKFTKQVSKVEEAIDSFVFRRDEVLSTIKEVLVDMKKIGQGCKLREKTRLEELGIDSLMTLNLIQGREEQFNIESNGAYDLGSFKKVGDLVHYVLGNKKN